METRMARDVRGWSTAAQEAPLQSPGGRRARRVRGTVGLGPVGPMDKASSTQSTGVRKKNHFSASATGDLKQGMRDLVYVLKRSVWLGRQWIGVSGHRSGNGLLPEVVQQEMMVAWITAQGLLTVALVTPGARLSLLWGLSWALQDIQLHRWPRPTRCW